MTHTLFRLFHFVASYLWRIVWAVIWPLAAPIAKRSPVEFNLLLNGSGGCRPHLYRAGAGWYGIDWGSINLEFFCPDEWDGRITRTLGLEPSAQC